MPPICWLLGKKRLWLIPQGDVEVYLEAARRLGATIQYVFETHLHADFVSGHNELALRTGAQIYIGPNSGARDLRRRCPISTVTTPFL